MKRQGFERSISDRFVRFFNLQCRNPIDGNSDLNSSSDMTVISYRSEEKLTQEGKFTKKEGALGQSKAPAGHANRNPSSEMLLFK